MPLIGVNMLHIPEAPSALKPTQSRHGRKRAPSPFDVIDKNISPITGGPDLEGELDRLATSNEASALVSIYRAYVSAAEAILGEENKPRAKQAGGFLGEEWCHLINKSYAVADKLKRIPITRDNADQISAVLLHAASAMGANLTEVAAVAVVLAAKEAEAK